MITKRPVIVRPVRAKSTLVAAITGLALAGCGPFGSEEDEVKDVVRDYAAGIADGDGGKVCDTIAEDSKEQFEQAGTKCEDAFKSFGAFLTPDQKDDFKNIDPDVSIDGDEATAEVDELGPTGQTEFRLKKDDGDWRITFQQ